ncbi:hypothetical protein LJR290_000179 [Variovorax sp. LjRoot290]|uniref:hypothetical protein n=1 Tax=Variovorax sp. LjRoot290 TaxID=3342316 RepID=UPI003ECF2306
MNASRLLEPLFRIPRGLWAVLAAPVPMRPAVRAKPRSEAPARREFRPTSFEAARPEVEPVAVQPAAPAPVMKAPTIVVQAPEAEAPVGAKTMRSLEEVRADLARLRQTARERHALAQQPARHVDTSFARTDFMEIPEPLPMSSPRKKDDSEFEATAFVGIPEPLPMPRKKDNSEFEATAFVDFAYPIPLLAR